MKKSTSIQKTGTAHSFGWMRLAGKDTGIYECWETPKGSEIHIPKQTIAAQHTRMTIGKSVLFSPTIYEYEFNGQLIRHWKAPQ